MPSIAGLHAGCRRTANAVASRTGSTEPVTLYVAAVYDVTAAWQTCSTRARRAAVGPFCRGSPPAAGHREALRRDPARAAGHAVRGVPRQLRSCIHDDLLPARSAGALADQDQQQDGEPCSCRAAHLPPPQPRGTLERTVSSRYTVREGSRRSRGGGGGGVWPLDVEMSRGVLRQDQRGCC